MSKQREALEAALEVLEQLQGGCTDSDDGTVEVLTVWCPEIIEQIQAALAEPEQEPNKPSEEVLNHAVNRFLGWKLPREFAPDNGIVFKLPRWEGFPLPEGWPIGTNLLTADQAKSMFKHCLDGAPLYTSPQPREWQPIETAPRDGTIIFGYWHSDTAELHARYSMFKWMDYGWFDPDGASECSQPTHWMPLPEPPAALRAKNEG